MAMHDQLTGLYNRYFLLAAASHKVSKSKRHTYALSVLMMDIDHFKAINDNHGHAVGDDVVVSNRNIDVHIRSLRKKLCSCSELIETIRGVGYRFKETR